MKPKLVYIHPHNSQIHISPSIYKLFPKRNPRIVFIDGEYYVKSVDCKTHYWFSGRRIGYSDRLMTKDIFNYFNVARNKSLKLMADDNLKLSLYQNQS